MSRAWAAPDDCTHCQVSRSASLGECQTCGRRFGQSRIALALFELPDWADRRLGGWLRSKHLHQIALYLACIPIFVAPPLLSLGMFALRLYREPNAGSLRRWKFVLIVAILNIVISVHLLGQISDLFWEVGMKGIRSIWEINVPEPRSLPGTQSIPV